MFLLYINDINADIKSKVRIVADDVSLFNIVEDPLTCFDELQHDLNKISVWANQCRLRFNHDITKQAVEVIFSTKITPLPHPSLMFNNIPIKLVNGHKHLGIILDKQLSFTSHINSKLSIARRGLGIISRLRKYLPRITLELIFKTFIRPLLEYGDIIFHQPPRTKEFSFDSHLKPLIQKLESLQYNAALVITGAWHGTSTDRIYEELGWESLTNRRWYRRLSLFFVIANNQAPFYLCKVISPSIPLWRSKVISPSIPLWRKNVNDNLNGNRFKNIFSRTIEFSDSFFPSCIVGWNELDEKLKKAINKKFCQSSLVKLVRPPKRNNTYIHVIQICDDTVVTPLSII